MQKCNKVRNNNSVLWSSDSHSNALSVLKITVDEPSWGHTIVNPVTTTSRCRVASLTPISRKAWHSTHWTLAYSYHLNKPKKKTLVKTAVDPDLRPKKLIQLLASPSKSSRFWYTSPPSSNAPILKSWPRSSHVFIFLIEGQSVLNCVFASSVLAK